MIIFGLIIWYLIGVVSFIYFKRFYRNVTIFDILVALTFGGALGIITLQWSLKYYYDYNVFDQIVFKAIIDREKIVLEKIREIEEQKNNAKSIT